jgi:hypothetical protein
MESGKFDDSLIDIIRKYGIAGLLAAGGLTMGGVKAQREEPESLLAPDS